jgi:hypothetical protein
MGPLDVHATYGSEGQEKVSDKMKVLFTKRSYKGSKGDTNLVVSIEGALTEPLDGNGVPAFVPNA